MPRTKQNVQVVRRGRDRITKESKGPLLKHDEECFSSPEHLYMIDKLRAKNIGTYLPIPQIIAVGDQSAAKSSTLESLTGIPLPRGQELCTRHPTQITVRRDEREAVTVKIISAPEASPEEKKRHEEFELEFNTPEELYEQFDAITNQVQTLMGIRTSTNPTGKKTFSRDILCIERLGPTEDHLTIIDVPGLFRVTTPGVTTCQDREMVKTLVKEYIQETETIILAIVPCNTDIATQEIISLAEEADPTGQRTLGILTKPDLLQERSAKRVICELVQGHRRHLELGYYVVVNRGADDNAVEDNNIDIREQMFTKEPWASLPKDRLGVGPLRSRLRELLRDITQSAYPKLRMNIYQMLEQTRFELEHLGPSRESPKDQRQYLLGIAGDYAGMARCAMAANYTDNSAFAENDSLRLITGIMAISEGFNDHFGKNGHTYINSEHISSEIDYQQCLKPEIVHGTQWKRRFDVHKLLSEINPRNMRSINDLATEDWHGKPPKPHILPLVRLLHRHYRGPELGTFSPHLLSLAFHNQILKWPRITEDYIKRCVTCVHGFILSAMHHVCRDARVRDLIIASLHDQLCFSYTRAMKKAMELLKIESVSKPFTWNHYFNSKLRNARINRLVAPVEADWGEGLPVMSVTTESLRSIVTDMSNPEHVAQEICDILQAYYKVASQRYVDNLYMQAVGRCLLWGEENPMELFCENWVLGLDEDKLSTIAGESAIVKEKRARLHAKESALEEALMILQGNL